MVAEEVIGWSFEVDVGRPMISVCESFADT